MIRNMRKFGYLNESEYNTFMDYAIKVTEEVRKSSNPNMTYQIMLVYGNKIYGNKFLRFMEELVS